MLILKNINVTLSKKTKLEYKIFSNLNLKVEKGEFIVVVGDNGAGKSTMLNIISGFLKPDTGQIIIDGQDVTKISDANRATFISKVMQDPKRGAIENMTIYENMAFAFKRGSNRGLRLFSDKSRKSFFQGKLSMLNMKLENRIDELVMNLSGGQRQAVSFIMAILGNSKILLLDEITSALDPVSSESIMQLISKIISEEKRTCVMITHNMSHAIKYGTRLLVLKSGEIYKEYDQEMKLKLTTVKLM